MGKIIGSTNEKTFAMVDAKKSGKPGKIDRIEICGNYVSLILYSTEYARIYDDKIVLGTYNGIWQSNTTKQRINAVSRRYNIPGVYQKNFTWYWSDNGARYEGTREFARGGK